MSRQNLSRRGLHGTALETCKLLLALDPGDPLGALFLVDYLALRSRQYGWLARFAAEWSPEVPRNDGGGGADNGSGGVEMLPNFAFSLALAAFWREKEPAGAFYFFLESLKIYYICYLLTFHGTFNQHCI